MIDPEKKDKAIKVIAGCISLIYDVIMWAGSWFLASMVLRVIWDGNAGSETVALLAIWFALERIHDKIERQRK